MSTLSVSKTFIESGEIRSVQRNKQHKEKLKIEVRIKFEGCWQKIKSHSAGLSAVALNVLFFLRSAIVHMDEQCKLVLNS